MKQMKFHPPWLNVSILLLFCMLQTLPVFAEGAKSTESMKQVSYNLEGLQNAALIENIEHTLVVPAKSPDLTEIEVIEFYEAAPHSIQKALEPFGYFKTQITSQLIASKNRWDIYFNVALGPPLPIHKIDLEI